MKDVPSAVKLMLAALSLATSLAISTAAYAFSSLAAEVNELKTQRERVVVAVVEIEYLKATLARIENELKEYRREVVELAGKEKK